MNADFANRTPFDELSNLFASRCSALSVSLPGPSPTGAHLSHIYCAAYIDLFNL